MTEQHECGVCGSTEDLYWPGSTPYCQDHYPDNCSDCGGEIETKADSELKRRFCKECRLAGEMGVFCSECHEAPRVTDWDYDGVRLSCGCSGRSAYVNHDRLKNSAPYTWKYDGRHGVRSMSGRL